MALAMTTFSLWEGWVVASTPSPAGRSYLLIIYILVPILLWTGLSPRGLITWPLATVLLLLPGHWVAGWIPLALVVFNLIGNALVEPENSLRPTARRRLIRRMELLTDRAKLVTYNRLLRTWEVPSGLVFGSSDADDHRLATAAVVNAVFGDQMHELHGHLDEHMVEFEAELLLEEDQGLRELAVQTIRVLFIVEFGQVGTAARESCPTLDRYGSSYPDSISPSEYESLVNREANRD